MEKIIVSIVIPVYNPPMDKFSQCMKSVLRQSYKDIEVILVDDGSRASIAEKMNSWMNCDSRVVVIHQKNGGVSSARNHGIAMAKGKYICFVDADDCLADIWLSKAVKEAENNKVDIVYGAVKKVSDVPSKSFSNMKQMHCLVFERKDLWCIQKIMLSQQKTPLSYLPNLDVGPCGKLFRTNIVKKILYPMGIPLMEDQVFNHAILRQANKVLVMDTLAYYYIYNNDSATHQYRPDAVEVLLSAMKKIRTLLFEISDVQNAFYYCLISQIISGIPVAYFHPNDDSLTIRQRREYVERTLNLPQVREAWENVDLHYVDDKKKKIIIYLIKKQYFYIFELLLIIKYYYKKGKNGISELKYRNRHESRPSNDSQ